MPKTASATGGGAPVGRNLWRSRREGLTSEGHLGQHKNVQILEVTRIRPVEDGVGAVQVVVEVTHMGGELEAADSHLGGCCLLVSKPKTGDVGAEDDEIVLTTNANKCCLRAGADVSAEKASQLAGDKVSLFSQDKVGARAWFIYRNLRRSRDGQASGPV